MTAMTPKSAVLFKSALSPKDYGSTAPTATQCINIDTKGFRWATFLVQTGTVTGTSIAVKVQESSDNFVSDAAADVTDADFTTLAATDDDQWESLTIDLQKCERYLQLAFTFSAITVANLAASCVLSGAADSAYIGTDGVDAAALGPFPA